MCHFIKSTIGDGAQKLMSRYNYNCIKYAIRSIVSTRFVHFSQLLMCAVGRGIALFPMSRGCAPFCWCDGSLDGGLHAFMPDKLNQNTLFWCAFIVLYLFLSLTHPFLCSLFHSWAKRPFSILYSFIETKEASPAECACRFQRYRH